MSTVPPKAHLLASLPDDNGVAVEFRSRRESVPDGFVLCRTRETSRSSEMRKVSRKRALAMIEQRIAEPVRPIKRRAKNPTDWARAGQGELLPYRYQRRR